MQVFTTFSWTINLGSLGAMHKLQTEVTNIIGSLTDYRPVSWACTYACAFSRTNLDNDNTIANASAQILPDIAGCMHVLLYIDSPLHAMFVSYHTTCTVIRALTCWLRGNCPLNFLRRYSRQDSRQVDSNGHIAAYRKAAVNSFLRQVRRWQSAGPPADQATHAVQHWSLEFCRHRRRRTEAKWQALLYVPRQVGLTDLTTLSLVACIYCTRRHRRPSEDVRPFSIPPL